MPELPDVLIYVEALRPRIVRQVLTHVRIVSPFLLRTFEPPIESAIGGTVCNVERIGKRIVFALDDDLFLVFHLMIAGRFRWDERAARSGDKTKAARSARLPGKITLAAFDFPTGRLLLTEASQKKRASLHIVRGRDALSAFDAGGLDVLSATPAEFAAALRRESHTLKRSLTDPRLFDGIGNAYSDEILHAARLSPVRLTSQLSDDEISRLHAATRGTLSRWIANLRRQFKDRFPGPGEITAFRPDFAVHGRFGHPCPACGAPVQRIRYAENETNYCPGCQTGGRILADRSLSRLLRDDWPRTLDELEQTPPRAK